MLLEKCTASWPDFSLSGSYSCSSVMVLNTSIFAVAFLASAFSDTGLASNPAGRLLGTGGIGGGNGETGGNSGGRDETGEMGGIG